MKKKFLLFSLIILTLCNSLQANWQHGQGNGLSAFKDGWNKSDPMGLSDPELAGEDGITSFAFFYEHIRSMSDLGLARLAPDQEDAIVINRMINSPVNPNAYDWGYFWPGFLYDMTPVGAAKNFCEDPSWSSGGVLALEGAGMFFASTKGLKYIDDAFLMAGKSGRLADFVSSARLAMIKVDDFFSVNASRLNGFLGKTKNRFIRLFRRDSIPRIGNRHSRVRDIDLDLLDLDEHLSYPGEIEEARVIAEQIKREGYRLDRPVQLDLLDNGRYEVANGNHRAYAMKYFLNQRTIPYVIPTRREYRALYRNFVPDDDSDQYFDLLFGVMED